jgi:hypothetical protein
MKIQPAAAITDCRTLGSSFTAYTAYKKRHQYAKVWPAQTTTFRLGWNVTFVEDGLAS